MICVLNSQTVQLNIQHETNWTQYYTGTKLAHATLINLLFLYAVLMSYYLLGLYLEQKQVKCLFDLKAHYYKLVYNVLAILGLAFVLSPTLSKKAVDKTISYLPLYILVKERHLFL